MPEDFSQFIESVQAESITESDNTDNSITEPTQVDNSQSNEPVISEPAGEAITPSDSSSEDVYKKSFGDDVDQDKVKNYLKKTYGEDVDISSLSDRELKALKSGYNAERMALEKAQKLSEIEKQKRDSDLNSQKTTIDSEELKLRQEYQTKSQEYIIQKAEALRQYTNEINNQGYTPEQISNLIAEYSYKLDNIHDQLKNDLNKDYSQKFENAHAQKNEYISKTKEKAFNEIAEKFEKDFETEPELKMLFDAFKEKFSGVDGFEDFVVPQFKEVIKSRDARLAVTKGKNTAIQQNSNKQKSITGETKTPIITGDPLTDDKALADLIRIRI